MPRFAILHHELPPASGRAAHWDLLLESGESLRTWALTEPPRGPATIAALPLPPHRLVYLEYEGPISQDRGHVARWDAGDYVLLAESPESVRVRLVGQRCTGELLLTRAADAWSAAWQPADSPPET